MLKKLLSVVAAAMLALPAFAVELRADHPESYTVKRGDTLWDISAKFLKSPWNWPEIWHANPQIENPHLIYPGDVLSLVYIDGKPYLVAAESGPRIRRESAEEAVRAIPLASIRQFLERARLMNKDEWQAAPYVIGLEENRRLGVNGQLAYVRQLDAPVGTRYAIARPSMVYRDVPKDYFWQKNNRERRASPWKNENGKTIAGGMNWLWYDWLYEKNTTVLGYEAYEVGTAEVVSEGDPASIFVKYVDQEIKKGDILLPIVDNPFDYEYVPHAPKSVPEGMRVLAFTEDAMNAVGPAQVVVLSRGAEQGVENGHTYSIFTPGETVRDTVRYSRDGEDLRTVFKPSKEKVTLPEEFIGHVMIFRTFDEISYGLIMDGVRPVHLGDNLRMPVE